MHTLARIPRLAAVAALVAISYTSPSAWANPADTYATIEFAPGATVPQGTLVTITGRAFCDESHGAICLAEDQALTVGKIQIEPAFDDTDSHVVCALQTDYGDHLGMGAPAFSADFDTTGLGGQTLGFRVHYVTPGGPHAPKTSSSTCANLSITLSDPLPDDTLSYGQGFYGSSPTGEAVVAQLIDEPTCSVINDILVGSGFESRTCETPENLESLALFLTGEVGSQGGNNDDGFLPAGNPSENGPGLNLAAQKITLLLNLNLDILEELPILPSYFINIDTVQDFISGEPGPFVDPVFNNQELYDFCEDTIDDGHDICDSGSLVLSELGELVQALDDAGTTVDDICTAALTLLDQDLSSVMVNDVEVSRGDMTDILGLINESYDEGVPSGFITMGDVD